MTESMASMGHSEISFFETGMFRVSPSGFDPYTDNFVSTTP
jgi:hypothetical protein